MRLRGERASPNRPRPRRAIVGCVYEKFKPIYEWRQEDDHRSLIFYLPGFRKEFIKVTTEDPNILRVRGERLVAGNKWNRFQEEFEVPETYKMSGIRAIFDVGILTIKMPKKIVDPPTIFTSDPKETIKRSKQDTDSVKPSSLTSATSLPSQPPMTSPDGIQSNEGVTDQKPLDRAEEKEPLIDQKTTTKKNNKLVGCYKRVVERLAMAGMEKERMRVVNLGVAVAGVVALSVFVYYATGFSRYES